MLFLVIRDLGEREIGAGVPEKHWGNCKARFPGLESSGMVTVNRVASITEALQFDTGKNMTIDLLMTNDVECHSFDTNGLDDSISKRVENEAMPPLLALYARFNARATFFFTANFARLSPRTVRSVAEAGHEVACHGYDHRDYYDVLPYGKQLQFLKKSKAIIEDIAGIEVLSFRAPALRVNGDTVRALEEAGFRYDSSVSSQRCDGPFTSGAARKLGWLLAPRRPYYMAHDNPFRAGDSEVLEVPVSAFLWPFIGTTLRISPRITLAVQKLLMLESKLSGSLLVFLFHPNEALAFTRGQTVRRGTYFSDTVRHALKMKNLGKPSLALLNRVCSAGDFNFICVSQAPRQDATGKPRRLRTKRDLQPPVDELAPASGHSV